MLTNQLSGRPASRVLPTGVQSKETSGRLVRTGSGPEEIAVFCSAGGRQCQGS
jgi:hypothetical protein